MAFGEATPQGRLPATFNRLRLRCGEYYNDSRLTVFLGARSPLSLFASRNLTRIDSALIENPYGAPNSTSEMPGACRRWIALHFFDPC